MKNVVQNKNGIYYFRFTIPLDLRHKNSANDISLSLGTKDKAEAETLALPLIKYSKYFIILCRQQGLKIMYRSSKICKKGEPLFMHLITSINLNGMNIKLDGSPEEVVSVISKLSPSKNIATPEVADSPLLTLMVKQFLTELKKLNFSSNTLTGYTSSLNELTGYLGETARVSDLTETTLKAVTKAIFAMPCRVNRSIDIKSLLQTGLPPRKYESSMTNFKKLKAFVKWLRRHDLLENNPMDNVFAPERKRTLETTSHASFSQQDLQTLFASDNILPLSRRYACRYWLLVLALLTGARRNELGQLLVSDVHLDEPIAYIDISPDKIKHVKNRSSIRKIPLHKKILELGFADYVNQIKKEKYTRLFPELKADKNGLIVDRTDWFLDYSKKCKIEPDGARRKVFHSFRHTFITELQRNNVPLEVRQSIAGHASGSITIDIYGEKTQLAVMKEAIDLVDFKLDIPVFKNLPSHTRKRKMSNLKPSA